MNMETQQIHSNLVRLVGQERKILADVLTQLQMISDKKLFLDFGRKSLLDYCIKELKYSESAAIRRIKALKLAREVPQIKEAIAAGDINLSQAATAQVLFERHSEESRTALAKKEKVAILEQIKGKGSLESENKIRDQLNLPRKLRAVKIEMEDETFEAWIKFKGSMIHKNWSNEKLLLYLLDLAEMKRQEKFGVALAKRGPSVASKTSKNQRYISEVSKRAVHIQSPGHCQHPGCKSIYGLEIDHVRPIAQGGQSTADNLRLLCRAHNQRRR